MKQNQTQEKETEVFRCESCGGPHKQDAKSCDYCGGNFKKKEDFLQGKRQYRHHLCAIFS